MLGTQIEGLVMMMMMMMMTMTMTIPDIAGANRSKLQPHVLHLAPRWTGFWLTFSVNLWWVRLCWSLNRGVLWWVVQTCRGFFLPGNLVCLVLYFLLSYFRLKMSIFQTSGLERCFFISGYESWESGLTLIQWFFQGCNMMKWLLISRSVGSFEINLQFMFPLYVSAFRIE